MLISEINNYLRTKFQRKLVVWLNCLFPCDFFQLSSVNLKTTFNNKKKRGEKKIIELKKWPANIYTREIASLCTLYGLIVFISKGIISFCKSLQGLRLSNLLGGEYSRSIFLVIVVCFCYFIAWVFVSYLIWSFFFSISSNPSWTKKIAVSIGKSFLMFFISLLPLGPL